MRSKWHARTHNPLRVSPANSPSLVCRHNNGAKHLQSHSILQATAACNTHRVGSKTAADESVFVQGARIMNVTPLSVALLLVHVEGGSYPHPPDENEDCRESVHNNGGNYIPKAVSLAFLPATLITIPKATIDIRCCPPPPPFPLLNFVCRKHHQIYVLHVHDDLTYE